MGRTRKAVEARARQIERSCRVFDALDADTLAECFGVKTEKVNQWVRKGLLKPVEGQFREDAIAEFIRECPLEYNLARVDQAWFKLMVFGSPSGYECQV